MTSWTRREFVQQAGFIAGGLVTARTARAAGSLRYRVDAADITLGNDAVNATWHLSGGVLKGLTITDIGSHRILPLSEEVVTLVLQDGTAIAASELQARARPTSACPEITAPPGLRTGSRATRSRSSSPIPRRAWRSPGAPFSGPIRVT